MGYDFELASVTSLVHPIHGQQGDTLSIDGEPVRAVLRPAVAPGEYDLDFGGRRERVYIATRADTHFIHWRGRAYRVDAVNALDRARRAAEPTGGAEILRAPMPGTVVAVATTEGAVLEAGALLLTIESMKLQTAITAPHAARVAEIFVGPGATFDQGDPLVRLEAPEGSEEKAQQDGEESK